MSSLSLKIIAEWGAIYSSNAQPQSLGKRIDDVAFCSATA
jgi:hypothetical protein